MPNLVNFYVVGVPIPQSGPKNFSELILMHHLNPKVFAGTPEFFLSEILLFSRDFGDT